MQPELKPIKFDIEDIKAITTGVSVSNHILKNYLNIYKELLSSVYMSLDDFDESNANNKSIIDNFRLGQYSRRSAKLNSIPYFKAQEFQAQDISKIRHAFLGPENNEFVNQYVMKDNLNDKGDEDKFLHDSDSDDMILPTRKLTYHTNVKSEYHFKDYINELKSGRHSPTRTIKNSKFNFEIDEDDHRISKPKRIRKTEIDNRMRGSKIAKPRFKLNEINEQDEANKELSVLKAKEDATYIMSYRNIEEKYLKYNI
jgi:hypothetical protein